MKVNLTFREPYDVSSAGLDGVVIAFPFDVAAISFAAERDVVTKHQALVSISGTLLSIWKFDRAGNAEEGLVKTLFEHARQRAIEAIQQGVLSETLEIPLQTNNSPRSNPFDPQKIPDPKGYTIELDVAADEKSLQRKGVEPMQATVPPEITDSLTRFSRDHPAAARTAFIMMPFTGSSTHNAIADGIKEILRTFGIYGLRADDKEYHDDLLSNVLTYVYGCSFGIAVFERIEDEYFNPNVSLEVGYMMALRKPILLLKDESLKALQADLVSKLYRNFNTRDVPNSLRDPIQKWLRDKDLIPQQESSLTQGISCYYHGHELRVRAFVEEAYTFEIFPTTTVTFTDGVSALSFNYTGDYPKEFFDRLAEKHGLNIGEYSQDEIA